MTTRNLSGMQGCFNIQNPINVRNNINKIKGKKTPSQKKQKRHLTKFNTFS